MKTDKKLYSVITNKYDNKDYIVSTVPWNKTRKIEIDKNKSMTVTFTSESGVYKKGKSSFMFFYPVVMIKVAEGAFLSQSDFHNLVCELVQKEHIGDLQDQKTYHAYGEHRYFVRQEDVFSPYEMRKKRVIYIHSKL